MKKLFLMFLTVLFLLGYGIFILLNSSALSAKIIPQLLAKSSKDISISDLKITKQTFNLSGILTLSDVSLQIKAKEDTFLVTFDSLAIKPSHLYSRKKAQILITLNGIKVKSKFLNFADADIDLQISAKGFITDGNFMISKLNYLEYELMNMTGNVSFEKQVFMIRRMKADFYGGQIETEILLENNMQLNYSGKITLKGIDIQQLEEINRAVFADAKGFINGEIEISSGDKKEPVIRGKIFSVSDIIEIKVTLIKPLLDYIPQSQQKKDLDLLIKRQGNIPLDTAEIVLLNTTDETIKTEVELKSKEFNLDIGVDLDFNIEGGFQNFLNLQKQYFLKKR